MTIDELAHQAGIPASTIRLYQTKGLLPPPVKQGRVGWYGQGHLARLRLVAQLQQEGFSLASIARLVDAWEHGRGLDAVLGLEAQFTATFAPEEPLRLKPEELASRFPEGSLTPALVQRTMALGLVGFDNDRVVINSPRFLEIGSELASLGIPVEDIIDEYEALQDATAAIAERFTGLFERHLWGPLMDRGLGPGDVRDLTDLLGRLGALAEGVVALTVRQSLERAATAFISAQAHHLDDAGPARESSQA
jgi:DNA-binding transcriptional MerR regulator